MTSHRHQRSRPGRTWGSPSGLRSRRAWAAPLGLLAATFAACAGYVGLTWLRYGHNTTDVENADPLLDEFMPIFEAVERHHIRVEAPAEITLAAAREMELFHLPLVRAIFKGRELIMRSGRQETPPEPDGMLAQVLALGWGVLAERPGREIVVGAVTRPWEAHVTFRALPPADFARFSEPGFAKIAWTLRADPAGPDRSIFRTETRVATTDASSRAKFRLYWSFLSPGIWLIRRASLAPLKSAAERRARLALTAAT
jgi:hypothetical protein